MRSDGAPPSDPAPRSAVTPLAAAAASAGRPVPIVQFDRVTKTYDDGFTAIKDVSFTIEDLPNKGEFITILGPSGCGKSTILRLIAGLRPQFPPTGGGVLVGGRPVERPGADRGMVFQDYTAFENRTVEENVAFGLECRGMPRKARLERARDWIRRVGLDPVRDARKYPFQLSGGMRQRVELARVLAGDSDILLMDEPFSALDYQTRLRMRRELVRILKQRPRTVVFVTHDIEEAAQLADRVLVLSNRPATISRELQINAQRPRDLTDHAVIEAMKAILTELGLQV